MATISLYPENITSSDKAPAKSDDSANLADLDELKKRAARARELLKEAKQYQNLLGKIVSGGYIIYGPQFWRAMEGRAEKCDSYEFVPGWNQSSIDKRIQARIRHCDEMIRVMEIALKAVPKAVRGAKDAQAQAEAMKKADSNNQVVQEDWIPNDDDEEEEDWRAIAHSKANANEEAETASQSSSSEEWQTVERKQKSRRQPKQPASQKLVFEPVSKLELFKIEQAQRQQAVHDADAEAGIEQLLEGIPLQPWNPHGKNRVEALVDVIQAILPILRARVEAHGADRDRRGKRVLYKSVPVFSLEDIREHCVDRLPNGHVHHELKQVVAEIGEEIRKVPGKTAHRLHPRDRKDRYLWGLFKSLINRMRDDLNKSLSDEEQKLGREWKVYLKDNTQTGEVTFDRVHFQQKNKSIPAPNHQETNEEPSGPVFTALDFPPLESALKA